MRRGRRYRQPTSGEVFLQRHTPNTRYFPGCWDIVGGHVGPGEGLLDTLAREIHEETGWRLATAFAETAKILDWTGSDGRRKREIDMLATVDGDLASPRLETDKFTAAGWFTEAGLRRLQATTEDTGMIDLALRLLTLARIDSAR